MANLLRGRWSMAFITVGISERLGIISDVIYPRWRMRSHAVGFNKG